MTTQLFSFETQPPRGSISRRERTSESQGKGYASGWLILVAMSVSFGAWMLYRWLAQPSWPASLPGTIAELLHLVELATAFTLALLWAGLLWRRRAEMASRSAQVLTVPEMYALSPKAFEYYVARLFRLKGYSVVIRGRSGDHGVDLELTAPDGRRAIVQCKRYRETVGEETVRDLFGTLLHEVAYHAFLVTTADISDAARLWATGKPLTLIDGPTLVQISSALHGSWEQ